MAAEEQCWKKCSVCKTAIPFKGRYWVCSVSTCNSKRTGLIFCSVNCFDRHLPGARHKNAAAIEERAPKGPEAANQAPAQASPVRRIIKTASSGQTKLKKSPSHLPYETLVVVSKLKDYIKAAGDMNTSSSCHSVISDIIRKACDQAIENARQDGRKTVMDRDFK